MIRVPGHSEDCRILPIDQPQDDCRILPIDQPEDAAKTFLKNTHKAGLIRLKTETNTIPAALKKSLERL